MSHGISTGELTRTRLSARLAFLSITKPLRPARRGMRQPREIASTLSAALAASAIAILGGGPAAVARSVPKCHGVRATKVGTRHIDLFQTGRGRDVVVGRGGNDVISAGRGNDLVCGNGGVDTLWGRSGTDKLYGGRGVDQIFGDGGADRLFGGSGGDVLIGGQGNDVILGAGGGDWLDGGKQRDRCTGGKPKRDFSPRRIRDYATSGCEVSRSAYHPS